MSKYIEADLLVRKIKGQIRNENLNFAALGGGGQTICINTLEWVLKQITSLQQEQPEVGVENYIQSYLEAIGFGYGGWVDGLRDEDLKKIARHFYKLGLKARKEE